MLRALEREPDLRFQTATDLASSLASVAGLPFRGATSTPEPGFASSSSSAPGTPRLGSGVPSSGGGYPGSGPRPASAAGTPFTAQSFSEPIPAATSAPLTASAPASARGSSKLGIAAAAGFGLLVGVAIILFRFGGARPSAPPTSSAAIVLPQTVEPVAVPPPTQTAEPVAPPPAPPATSTTPQPGDSPTPAAGACGQARSEAGAKGQGRHAGLRRCRYPAPDHRPRRGPVSSTGTRTRAAAEAGSRGEQQPQRRGTRLLILA